MNAWRHCAVCDDKRQTVKRADGTFRITPCEACWGDRPDMIWVMLAEGMTTEHLGLLPGMLDPNDPRPAKEQFNENYQHGGGWHSQPGFKLLDSGWIKYPGDPPFCMVAFTMLRDEIIALYEHDYVAIVQPDGSFEICRMD